MSKVYTGNNLTLRGNHLVVTGNNSNIHGDHCVVTGNNAKVFGHHCTVTGNNAKVLGHHARVNGNNTSIKGDHGTIRGNNGKITGKNGQITGNHGIINGKNGSSTPSTPSSSVPPSFSSSFGLFSNCTFDSCTFSVSVNGRTSTTTKPKEKKEQHSSWSTKFDLSHDTPISSDDGKDDENACTICYENHKKIVFIPCGHRQLCIACAIKLPEKSSCPFCKKTIDDAIETF
mmetsp:Transcript_20120/g.27745  ORF Transcript_20120/g.27745 Transcript_20120/m.27745 type:complete len:230 (+) Transcript_20120:206-895(+)